MPPASAHPPIEPCDSLSPLRPRPLSRLAMAVEHAIANCMAETTKGEYRSGHDSRTLRDALGCFATGVTVVTCLKPDGEPAGLTVNSFTSVSLDPPLLLVCLARKATSAAALIAASHFAGNVLQTGQQP